ncbi:MAG: glycine/betaine ABC transporter permease, partial [Pseudonocardiaceae bacterium]
MTLLQSRVRASTAAPRLQTRAPIVSVRQVLLAPAVVLGAMAAFLVWLAQQPLDNIEARTLTVPNLSGALREHLVIVGISTLVVTALAIPLGIALTRPAIRPFAPLVQAFVVVGQSVPVFGLIVLFAVLFGLGRQYAIIALVISAFLPVLSNT